MHRFLIFFVLAGFALTHARDVALLEETKIDYTTKFWIESKNAITDSFLIKVFLPPDYFKSDTIHFVTDADAFWGAATDYPWFLHFNNPRLIAVGQKEYSSSFSNAIFTPNPETDRRAWRRQCNRKLSSSQEDISKRICLC